MLKASGVSPADHTFAVDEVVPETKRIFYGAVRRSRRQEVSAQDTGYCGSGETGGQRGAGKIRR
jgi:hypothetical protein